MNKVYVVPVSGGKDSQAVCAWALDKHDRTELRFVHQNTTFDHPLTYQHLQYMECRYRITIEMTTPKDKDMFAMLRRVGLFPNSVARKCTGEMKQEPMANWLRENQLNGSHTYLGIRSDESRKRQQKYGEIEPTDTFLTHELYPHYQTGLEECTISFPIVNWTTEDVFSYLNNRGDDVNPLYKRGHHRVGCYPCLIAGNREWNLASSDPVGRERMEELIKIEDEWSKNPPLDKRNGKPHVLIKLEKDVRSLLNQGQAFPDDEAGSNCGYCSF